VAAVELARKALELLIVAAMPMVEKNASSIARLMPARIEKQELADAGYVALVEAAQFFDANRTTTLAQYARLRVRGAMWDLVRRRNWTEMSHLELRVEFIEMPDERQAPEAMLEETRLKARSAEAMTCLSERERLVVKRYYAGEELVAIGRDIGLCKQTMTNIHRKALGKMQEYFRLRGIKAA
jgi:RNA polymerase sigma factor (sigma-70 family)